MSSAGITGSKESRSNKFLVRSRASPAEAVRFWVGAWPARLGGLPSQQTNSRPQNPKPLKPRNPEGEFVINSLIYGRAPDPRHQPLRSLPLRADAARALDQGLEHMHARVQARRKAQCASTG